VEFSPSSSADGYEGTNFTVSDATTGQKLSSDVDENVLGVFAGYRPSPSATFLRISDDNKLQILEASAK
jgi:hypothetical protein